MEVLVVLIQTPLNLCLCTYSTLQKNFPRTVRSTELPFPFFFRSVPVSPPFRSRSAPVQFPPFLKSRFTPTAHGHAASFNFTTLLLQLLDEVIVARRRGVYSFLLRASAAGNKTGSKTGTMLFLTPFHAPFKPRSSPVQAPFRPRSGLVQTQRARRSWEVFFYAYCICIMDMYTCIYTIVCAEGSSIEYICTFLIDSHTHTHTHTLPLFNR